MQNKRTKKSLLNHSFSLPHASLANFISSEIETKIIAKKTFINELAKGINLLSAHCFFFLSKLNNVATTTTILVLNEFLKLVEINSVAVMINSQF